jgi:hypothetical protein
MSNYQYPGSQGCLFWDLRIQTCGRQPNAPFDILYNWTSPKNTTKLYVHELHISSANQSHQGCMGMTPQYANPHDDIPDNLCPHQHSVLEKCIPVMYPLALLELYFLWFPTYKIKISTCTHLLLLPRLHCSSYFPLLLLCLVYTLSVVC